MKKLLTILFILCCFGGFAQVKVVGYLTTNGATLYPTHLDSLGYGGYRIATDTTERNAITCLRRKFGMAVFTQSDSTLWVLLDYACNNTWGKLNFGTTSGIDSNSYHSLSTLTDTSGYVLIKPNGTRDTFRLPHNTLTYPYLVKRYLNGYGVFAELNTDSITESSTKKFLTTTSQTITGVKTFADTGYIPRLHVTGGLLANDSTDKAATTDWVKRRIYEATGGPATIYAHWGDITGTLTDQSDLVSYIAAQLLPKVNYTDTATMLVPYVRKNLTLAVTYPLTGGGNLSANRTFGLDTTDFHGRGYYDLRYKSIGTAETDPLFDSKFAIKTTDDLTEGSTQKYFTNARARAALSLTTTGSGAATYNNTTGVFNIPSAAAVVGTNTQVPFNRLGVMVGGDSLNFDNRTLTAQNFKSRDSVISNILTSLFTPPANDSSVRVPNTLWVKKRLAEIFTDTTSLSNRINLKLNITDTANKIPRIFAGTNVTITGTFPNRVINATGSGTGVDSGAYRSSTLLPDSSGFTLNRLSGLKDTFSFAGFGGGSTDTTSLSNRISRAYKSLTLLPDSSGIVLVRENATKDTVSFSGGGGGSPLVITTSADSLQVYFAHDGVIDTLDISGLFDAENNYVTSTGFASDTLSIARNGLTTLKQAINGFVHTTGTETIAGNKTLTGATTINNNFDVAVGGVRNGLIHVDTSLLVLRVADAARYAGIGIGSTSAGLISSAGSTVSVDTGKILIANYGDLIITGLPKAPGNKALRINTATGKITYADTTLSSGGASVFGTNRSIAFNGQGTETGNDSLKWAAGIVNVTGKVLTTTTTGAAVQGIATTTTGIGVLGQAAYGEGGRFESVDSNALIIKSTSTSYTPKLLRAYSGANEKYFIRFNGIAQYANPDSSTLNDTSLIYKKYLNQRIAAIGATAGITALTGDVTASGTGSVAATIANNAVTNAKAAQMPTMTFKGNATGSTANQQDLSISQAQTMLDLASGTYTPTTGSNFNIGSVTTHACQYLRVGSTIHVSGRIDITPSAAGQFSIKMQIPILVYFGNPWEAAGTGVENGATSSPSPIMISAWYTSLGLTGGCVTLEGKAANTTTEYIYFTYTYTTPAS